MVCPLGLPVVPAHLVAFWPSLVDLLEPTHFSGLLTPWNSGISTSLGVGHHLAMLLGAVLAGCSHHLRGSLPRTLFPPAGPVFHLLGQARPAPVPCGLICLLQDPAGCSPSYSAVWSSSSIRPRVSPAELCCQLALAAGVGVGEGAVSEKDACCFAGERPPGGHQAGGCYM